MGRVVAGDLGKLRGTHQQNRNEKRAVFAKAFAEPIEREDGDEPGYRPDGSVDSEQLARGKSVAPKDVEDRDVIIEKGNEVKAHRECEDNDDEAHEGSVSDGRTHVVPELRLVLLFGDRKARFPERDEPPERKRNEQAGNEDGNV